MAWDIHIDDVDHVPRPILGIGNHYADGHHIDPHHHRRGQLISGTSGLIVLSTAGGTWVMPPQRGMWIPPHTVHHVRMVGAVQVQSLFLDPDAIEGMPDQCRVVAISPFMRGLITQALDLPLDHALDGREGALMHLIHHEMRRLPILPLSLHFPTHGPLAARCRAFVRQPGVHQTIDDWAAALGMARRTFTRLFRQETGMSFQAWRQQACLLWALPRLVGGEPVTSVAIDLGYENPAAFTLAFRRAFGSPPLVYLGLREGSRPA